MLSELEGLIEGYLNNKQANPWLARVLMENLYILSEPGASRERKQAIKTIAEDSNSSIKEVEALLLGLADYLVEKGYSPETEKGTAAFFDSEDSSNAFILAPLAMITPSLIAVLLVIGLCLFLLSQPQRGPPKGKSPAKKEFPSGEELAQIRVAIAGLKERIPEKLKQLELTSEREEEVIFAAGTMKMLLPAGSTITLAQIIDCMVGDYTNWLHEYRLRHGQLRKAGNAILAPTFTFSAEVFPECPGEKPRFISLYYRPEFLVLEVIHSKVISQGDISAKGGNRLYYLDNAGYLRKIKGEGTKPALLEVCDLSLTMKPKSFWWATGLDGSKTLTLANKEVLLARSDPLEEAVVRELKLCVASFISSGILCGLCRFGPDMNTGELQDVIIDEAYVVQEELGFEKAMLASTSGSSNKGSFSHAELRATSLSAVETMIADLENPDLTKKYGINPKNVSIAIQGFGEVATGMILYLKETYPELFQYLHITALSNVPQDNLEAGGGIHSSAGLDISAIFKLVDKRNELLAQNSGIDRFRLIEGYTSPCVRFKGTEGAREILFQGADIIMPAAVPDVFRTVADIKRLKEAGTKAVYEPANNSIRPNVIVSVDEILQNNPKNISSEQLTDNLKRYAGQVIYLEDVFDIFNIYLKFGPITNSGGIRASREQIEHWEREGRATIIRNMSARGVHVQDDIADLSVLHTLWLTQRHLETGVSPTRLFWAAIERLERDFYSLLNNPDEEMRLLTSRYYRQGAHLVDARHFAAADLAHDRFFLEGSGGFDLREELTIYGRDISARMNLFKLGRVKIDDATRKSLLPQVRDLLNSARQVQVRKSAAECLGFLSDPQAKSALARAARDPDIHVRVWAKWALERIDSVSNSKVDIDRILTIVRNFGLKTCLLRAVMLIYLLRLLGEEAELGGMFIKGEDFPFQYIVLTKRWGQKDVMPFGGESQDYDRTEKITSGDDYERGLASLRKKGYLVRAEKALYAERGNKGDRNSFQPNRETGSDSIGTLSLFAPLLAFPDALVGMNYGLTFAFALAALGCVLWAQGGKGKKSSSPLYILLYRMLRRIWKRHGFLPIDFCKIMALVYTPRIAEVATKISKQPVQFEKLVCIRNNPSNPLWIVTDGSAVLGLGSIGYKAAGPVMEGKQALLKWFANVDANILLVDTQEEWSQEGPQGPIAVAKKIVEAAEGIKDAYGKNILVMLEDIARPACFYVERMLNSKKRAIPTIHDDQHGTAIVLAAGVINALRLAKKKLEQAKIVISGAGASGIAVCRLLNWIGVVEIICFDTKGAISAKRQDLNFAQKRIVAFNCSDFSGSIQDALRGADGFIGLSKPGLFADREEEVLSSMKPDSFVFACSNPAPEFNIANIKRLQSKPEFPVKIVACGNFGTPRVTTLNNCYAFPGVYMALIDLFEEGLIQEGFTPDDILELTKDAAYALAALAGDKELNSELVLPATFGPAGYDLRITQAVATAVYNRVSGTQTERYENLPLDLQMRHQACKAALKPWHRQLLRRLSGSGDTRGTVLQSEAESAPDSKRTLSLFAPLLAFPDAPGNCQPSAVSLQLAVILALVLVCGLMRRQVGARKELFRWLFIKTQAVFASNDKGSFSIGSQDNSTRRLGLVLFTPLAFPDALPVFVVLCVIPLFMLVMAQSRRLSGSSGSHGLSGGILPKHLESLIYEFRQPGFFPEDIDSRRLKGLASCAPEVYAYLKTLKQRVAEADTASYDPYKPGRALSPLNQLNNSLIHAECLGGLDDLGNNLRDRDVPNSDEFCSSLEAMIFNYFASLGRGINYIGKTSEGEMFLLFVKSETAMLGFPFPCRQTFQEILEDVPWGERGYFRAACRILKRYRGRLIPSAGSLREKLPADYRGPDPHQRENFAMASNCLEIAPDERVCDFGCADGAFFDFLLETGRHSDKSRLTGVERSKAQTAAAKSKGYSVWRIDLLSAAGSGKDRLEERIAEVLGSGYKGVCIDVFYVNTNSFIRFLTRYISHWNYIDGLPWKMFFICALFDPRERENMQYERLEAFLQEDLALMPTQLFRSNGRVYLVYDRRGAEKKSTRRRRDSSSARPAIKRLFLFTPILAFPDALTPFSGYEPSAMSYLPILALLAFSCVLWAQAEKTTVSINYGSVGLFTVNHYEAPQIEAEGQVIAALEGAGLVVYREADRNKQPQDVTLEDGHEPHFQTRIGNGSGSGSPALAAPKVTGTIAELLVRNPTLTPKEAVAIVLNNATALSNHPAFPLGDLGRGLLNKEAALAEAAKVNAHRRGQRSVISGGIAVVMLLSAGVLLFSELGRRKRNAKSNGTLSLFAPLLAFPDAPGVDFVRQLSTVNCQLILALLAEGMWIYLSGVRDKGNGLSAVTEQDIEVGKEILAAKEIEANTQTWRETYCSLKRYPPYFYQKLMQIYRDKAAIANGRVNRFAFFKLYSQIRSFFSRKYRNRSTRVHIGFGFYPAFGATDSETDNRTGNAFVDSIGKSYGRFLHNIRIWMKSCGLGTGILVGTILGCFFLAFSIAFSPVNISPPETTICCPPYLSTISSKWAVIQLSLSILFLCFLAATSITSIAKYTTSSGRSQEVSLFSTGLPLVFTPILAFPEAPGVDFVRQLSTVNCQLILALLAVGVCVIAKAGKRKGYRENDATLVSRILKRLSSDWISSRSALVWTSLSILLVSASILVVVFLTAISSTLIFSKFLPTWSRIAPTSSLRDVISSPNTLNSLLKPSTSVPTSVGVKTSLADFLGLALFLFIVLHIIKPKKSNVKGKLEPNLNLVPQRNCLSLFAPI
ncbi:MAG: hypothetical protein JW714_01545 [Candidatus Omnitrophica bacterium]|nr:hypothetical protein [Candidatus Omnitrophota bacterium]